MRSGCTILPTRCRTTSLQRVPKLVRDHSLLITVLMLGLLALVFYTWAEWQYFADQAHEHSSAVGSFWSKEHFHDWAYNAASNWQSELLFGVGIVVILHRLPGGKK